MQPGDLAQESASRNARRSDAWIRVRGEADDRRRIDGFVEDRPRASGREDARRAAQPFVTQTPRMEVAGGGGACAREAGQAVPRGRRRNRPGPAPAGVPGAFVEGAAAAGGGASEEIFKSWLDGLRSLATFSRPSHGAEALERGDL